VEQNAKAAVAKKIGLIDGLVVRAGVFYYDQIFLRYAGGANTIPKPVILSKAQSSSKSRKLYSHNPRQRYYFRHKEIRNFKARIPAFSQVRYVHFSRL